MSADPSITLPLSVVVPRLKPEICGDRRVLVVDDEPVTRKIAKALLERVGFAEVETAADGQGALALLRTGSYGLVVADYLMDPMSGLELFRAMRAERLAQDIPFLMMTASLNHELVLAAKRAGIRHYILKPFRPQALHEKLVDILSPF